MEKLFHFLKRLDIYFTGAMMVCIFFDIMLQVITRITPNTVAVPWTVEMGSILLCALIWVGLGQGISNKSHIRFTMVIDKFPKAKKWFDLWSDLIFFVFCVVLAIYTFKLLSFYSANGTATTILRWGKAYTKLPMFIGVAIAAVRLAYSFVATLLHFKEASAEASGEEANN